MTRSQFDVLRMGIWDHMFHREVIPYGLTVPAGTE